MRSLVDSQCENDRKTKNRWQNQIEQKSQRRRALVRPSRIIALAITVSFAVSLSLSNTGSTCISYTIVYYTE